MLLLKKNILCYGMKILVTGGCGYIGVHTLVDLIENGFSVISLDDNSRSSPDILAGVRHITGVQVRNYAVNLCDKLATEAVFAENPDIVGIIHFAAYKSVPESVAYPLRYYHNNIESLLNLLSCVQQYDIPHFVFSSSCSVYGNTNRLPVTEDTPLEKAESPYGHTKQIGESIIKAFADTAPHSKHILLRYFNPVGAHLSAHIGEIQPVPQNLVPFITQTAIGKRAQLTVYGSDYPTRDGTCVRDYIHVSDIAAAHTLALRRLMGGQMTSNCEWFNLGSGDGTTVLEAIAAFERSTGQTLNYYIGARRAGDVAAIYADNARARDILGWLPKFSLDDMMRSAWEWEKKCANL